MQLLLPLLSCETFSAEKGTNRVWSIGNKDVDIHNLENGVDLQWPLEVLNTLKRSMHEMTGVPESALGQSQPFQIPLVWLLLFSFIL